METREYQLQSWALNIISGASTGAIFVVLILDFIKNYGYISATLLIIAISIVAVVAPVARTIVQILCKLYLLEEGLK